MTTLDFLYISLGGGFILLVIFLCVLLLHLTLVLRDVSKATANLKDVSDRLKEAIFDPLKTLSEMSAGFSLVHGLVEKIRARYAEVTEDSDEDQVEEEDNSDEDKSDTGNKKEKSSHLGFLVKKLRK